jgi:hydrogenase maturation protein HypF
MGNITKGVLLIERFRLTVRGKVQGVGFRPYVFRFATALNLVGFVKNIGGGVMVEIQGEQNKQFIDNIRKNSPPLAEVSSIEVEAIPEDPHASDFKILDSCRDQTNTHLPADMAICDQCVNDLFNKKSRFYLYPFVSCVHCGPRFSITYQLPFDRQTTAMQDFLFCASCLADYDDPKNRRFHAQPLACPTCGPSLSHSIEEIIHHIKAGNIIALKGMGGYQLICDATNEAAIETLRARKRRQFKPFAIMALNCLSVKEIALCGLGSEKLLTHGSRPIVLLPKSDGHLPESIAPCLNHLGVMLPATPLHYLLFYGLAGFSDNVAWLDRREKNVLIVTSGNIHGQPLIKDDQDIENLKEIADLIVSYNRKITTHVDDSVIKIINQSPAFIRRSRGFVPEPILLPEAIPSTLAVGGHLKNTICLTRGNEAFVSQHIGDMSHPKAIHYFHETIRYMQKLLNIKPQCIAYDLHPNFYSTRFMQKHDLPTHGIQHHHAHLAAVAAECGLTEPILGLALDGYGYGADGSPWGGEMMLIKGFDYLHLGSLLPIPLPGGEQAVREPWRIAVGLLDKLGCRHEIAKRFIQYPTPIILEMISKNINTPLTSSCGRLFDAAAAMLGILCISEYEGHAAMMLESKVNLPKVQPGGWLIEDSILNLLPLFLSLIEVNQVEGANIFHGTLIAAFTDWVLKFARRQKIKKIVLSGGCFSNQILSEGLTHHLKAVGIQAYLPQKLPPNDGGISLGQAWIGGKKFLENFAC